MHNYTLFGIIIAGLGSLVGLYFIHKGNALSNKEKSELLSQKLEYQSEQLSTQEEKVDTLEKTNRILIIEAEKLNDKNVELLTSNQGINESNNDLLKQNIELTDKIDNYQDEIKEKDMRIRQLEENAKKVSRGNVSVIQYDGSHLIKKGGSTTITQDTDEYRMLLELRELEKDSKWNEAIRRCDEIIASGTTWLTPYVIKAISLINTGKIPDGIKLLEYVENQTPGDEVYTKALMNIYGELGNQAKVNQLFLSLPKEVQDIIKYKQKKKE